MHQFYPVGGIGVFNGTPSSSDQGRFTLPTIQRADPGFPTNANNLALTYDAYLGYDASDVPAEIGRGTAHRLLTQHDDYHYRFWLNPTSYTLRDPDIGVVFSFSVWNTFYDPSPNTIVDIIFNGVEGVVPVQGPGDGVLDFAIGTFGFYITDDAPTSMDGTIEYIFDSGSFEFGLIIERDTTIPLPPNFPWTETLKWETNILVSEDGTEQRICLSVSPEITHTVSFTSLDQEETNTIVRQILTTARNAPTVPLYQYATPLMAEALSGAVEIEASPKRGDLRAGDSVILRTRQGLSELARIQSVLGTTITLTSGLQNNFKRGTLVIPARDLVVPTEQTINLWRVQAGQYMFSGRPRVRRNPFLAAHNEWTFTEVNGRPILEKRPLGNDQQSIVLDSGRRFQEQGRVIATKDPWGFSRQNSPVSFHIDTFFTPTDWDHWRTFMAHCRGAQKTFLFPSFRDDFILADPVSEQSAQITVGGNIYTTTLHDEGIYPVIRVQTAAGVHYGRVSASTVVDPTKETIFFENPLPEGLDWTMIQQISLVSINRLLTDEVKIEHYPQHSILTATFRTTKE